MCFVNDEVKGIVKTDKRKEYESKICLSMKRNK